MKCSFLKDKTLSTTLLTHYGLLLVSATLVIAWFSYQLSFKMLKSEFHQRAQTIANSFAYQSRDALIVLDPYIINQIAKDILQEEDVVYTVIYNQNGALLQHNLRVNVTTLDLDQRIQIEKLTKSLRITAISIDKRKVYAVDILQRVLDPNFPGQTLGAVRVGVSLDRLMILKNKWLLHSALVIFLVMLLGSTLSIMFSKKNSRALKNVIAAMRNIIEKGDLSERIQTSNQIKEIYEIQHCFNQMNKRLQKSQSELKESGDRLKLALSTMNAGVWDWNVKTGDVIFSERMVEMLGYQPGELKEHISTWKKLIHPDDQSRVRKILSKYLNSDSSLYQTEHRLQTKNEGWKWILNTGRVVHRDKSGAATRVIGTHIDIHNKKKNEIELMKHRENLETIVAERTMKLEMAQKELINQAMEAGRAQLAAMVLHNIGNAVTPIRVQLSNAKSDSTFQTVDYLEKCLQDLNSHTNDLQQYVQKDERGKQVFSYMGTLVAALKEAESLRSQMIDKWDQSMSYIAEVLTLQQAYASSDRENKERVNINSLLKDSVRMQTGALEKREISMIEKFDQKMPKIVIDKNRLMQVIVNIIKNGYEAIDLLSDESQVKRMVFRTFINNAQIGFSIDDSGIGVDPMLIDKIFEYGQSSKGSSGFGLYYCRMFVEANGGSMVLTSPGKGKGATVTVCLPYSQNGTPQH